MKQRLAWTIAVVVACAGFAGPGAAQPQREQHRHAPAYAHGPMHLDQRYHHDHYYPARGHVVGVLPSGTISIAFGGGSWYFRAGVWYRPVGTQFVVAVPPVGIVVPFLPPAYVTLWIGGAPYYYANGVYYAPAPALGYTVVAPPPGADTAQPAPPPAPPSTLPEPVIYPRNGQSPAQLAADRQDCQRWAAGQPGAQTDASVMQRGLAACMDARGYTVR